MIYGLTVITLIVVLVDERVFWFESMMMVIFYLGYIVIMVFNSRIERWALRVKKKVMTGVKKHEYKYNGLWFMNECTQGNLRIKTKIILN